MLNKISKLPTTKPHCGTKRSVHWKGTPRRNPRNSGGSPSGVNKPAVLLTMTMKKRIKKRQEFTRQNDNKHWHGKRDAENCFVTVAVPPPRNGHGQYNNRHKHQQERNQTPKRQAQRGRWHTQPIISRNRMCASLGL